MLGVVLCCKHEWNTIIDYFVKRPWGDAYQIKPEDIFNMYSKKGIINQSFIDIMFKPLFDAKNIPMDITMKGFYDWSGIDLHLFSLELNAFEMCDISHKTHPDIPVLMAVHMTSAIPVLFSPVCLDGKCYVDGGIMNNYPINYCLKDHPEVDDILSFKNVSNNSHSNIDNDSTIMDVIVLICSRLLKHANLSTLTEDIPNQINQTSCGLSAGSFQETLFSEPFRQGLVDEGIETAREFIRTLAKIG
jgi:predicted acylesterase/phospholipase RssA